MSFSFQDWVDYISLDVSKSEDPYVKYMSKIGVEIPAVSFSNGMILRFQHGAFAYSTVDKHGNWETIEIISIIGSQDWLDNYQNNLNIPNSLGYSVYRYVPIKMLEEYTKNLEFSFVLNSEIRLLNSLKNTLHLER